MRKKHAAHENHERWLVSYADFITLLFAFFVVMFASSQADKGRAKAVSEAVQKAFENGRMPAIAAILGGTVDDKGKGNDMMHGPGGRKVPEQVQVKAGETLKLVELLPSMQVLSAELQEEIRKGKVELHLEPRGLVVTLREAAFFNSGDDAVQRSAYPTIAKLAGVINKLPNAIRFEGHTDSVPISTARFRSNWELSAARGIAMLELFNTKYGVDRQRMAIVGYADTVALDSNKTEEGRARNRRVDIVIVSDMGMRVEPGQPAKPSPAPVPAGPETKDKRKEKA